MRRDPKSEITLDALLKKRALSILESFDIDPENEKTYHESYKNFLARLPAALSKKYKDLDQTAQPLEIESVMFGDIEKILKYINPEMTGRLKEWNQIHALSPHLITFMVTQLNILPKDVEVIVNTLENKLYQHNNRDKVLEIVQRYTESATASTSQSNSQAFFTFLKHLESSDYNSPDLITELYSMYKQNNSQ